MNIIKIAKQIYRYKLENIIAKQIFLSALTEQQKKKTDVYTNKRDKNLTFGDMFKNERTYFTTNFDYEKLISSKVPYDIKDFLYEHDYICENFIEGKAHKIHQKKNYVSIGKLIVKFLKNDITKQKKLLKIFNERLKGGFKKSIKCLICITHNPYDISGMSTDRRWTSCTRFGGPNEEQPATMIIDGGMCAYLIKQQDKRIEDPLARISIKRLLSQDQKAFIFQAQHSIYSIFSWDTKNKEHILKPFLQQVDSILQKSNKKTKLNYSYFKVKHHSLSDTKLYTSFIFDNLNEFQKFLENNPRKIDAILDSFNRLNENQKKLVIEYLFKNNLLEKFRLIHDTREYESFLTEEQKQKIKKEYKNYIDYFITEVYKPEQKEKHQDTNTKPKNNYYYYSR